MKLIKMKQVRAQVGILCGGKTQNTWDITNPLLKGCELYKTEGAYIVVHNGEAVDVPLGNVTQATYLDAEDVHEQKSTRSVQAVK